ncbi:arginase family protein [Janthinobacterium fluminis]|uniref:Arginase family protein n=1 Tax=Janthinobacterium fluminis TaxID=2987524 RepID=A0ABT5JTN9_9BURK|nr:arginase family protein [Janthinobacterium fluminis]MDC8756107.1 arginase family protein [Janthinobacterium fluminis]
MNNHLIVPYLMGQRRNGLCRVAELARHGWDVVADPDLTAASVAGSNEKMRRMGKIYALLSEAVRLRVRAGGVPISLAGDCMSTLGVLAGLQKAGRTPERMLWLDAHGDFHTWGTTQTQYLGGMPLAVLVGRGDRRQAGRDAIGALVAQIGVRPYPEQRILLSDARDLDPGEAEAIAASAIVTCAIEDIVSHLAPRDSLYLHWDTDVVNAEADMPALKYHVKHGPSWEDMHRLFRSLRGHNIIAVSVSAWHEEADADNKTALACLALLSELGLGAEAREGR